eukprot:jgi/Galph1/4997/GphlegSOOS_G3675.1
MSKKIVVHPQLNSGDPCTYSQPEKYFTRKVSLEIEVEPFERRIRGIANIQLECMNSDGNFPILLDVRSLKIIQVEDTCTRKLLSFEERKGGKFGDILCIFLAAPVGEGQVVEMSIRYETDATEHPAGSACGWLNAEQTLGGRYPCLFTQSQPVHARSLFPCQDSPCVKCPYEITVAVPMEFKAVVSGILVNEKERFQGANGKLQNIYFFEQPIPIPSYLVSLAVGELECQELSERCRIWAEPELVENACFEFGSTERFLKTAESMAGFYVWSRYDLLCLPPYFPYGGMENPCLTFVTSTLLVGDRSLVYIIINEIAHSWSGNLVTCATWNHLWLNDGIATYFARKIIARVLHSQNPSKGSKLFFGLEATIGQDSLRDAIQFFGPEHNYTRLVPLIDKHFDPDDAFSVVPFEKGFNLLLKLEYEVGGEERLLGFLRMYFEYFKFQSISTDDFVSCFSEYFVNILPESHLDRKGRIVLNNFDWDVWLYGTGHPPEYASFNLSLVDYSRSLAQQCLDTECKCLTPAHVEGWQTTQMVVFLNSIFASGQLSREAVQTLDEQVKFTKGKWNRNAEVRFIWLRVSLRAQYHPSVDNAVDFITAQGRMKYIRPIYKDLHYIYPQGNVAVTTFQAHRQKYHSIAAKLVSRDLGLGG